MQQDTGRIIQTTVRLIFAGSPEPDVELVPVRSVWCEGTSAVADGLLTIGFHGGSGVFRCKVSRSTTFAGNGMSVRLRVSGWDSLRAVLIGYMHGNEFKRLRIPNLLQNEWLAVEFGQSDLSYRLQNGWEHSSRSSIGDIRLNFEGKPTAAGARLEIEEICLWNEADDDFQLLLAEGPTTFSTAKTEPNLSMRFEPVRRDLLQALDTHLARFFADGDEQAKAFLATGEAPSHNASIAWSYDAALPPKAQTQVINRWAWHALRPVTVLLTHARNSGAIVPVFAARDFINAWLDRSYYAIDPDEKYCWYDHGVAGRMIALVLMWDYGVQLGFDQRFMIRLLEAIYRHMQLLASEAFYACYQSTRYHNHAVFQDLALMLAGLGVPELACSRNYFALAAARVKNQVEALVVQDGEFGVQIENSIGYHQGFEALIQTAHDFIKLGNIESDVPRIVEGMTRFTQLSRYVDGRSPAFGDSQRNANSSRRDAKSQAPYATPELTLLPRAGYAFVKGNHERAPFMLSLTASALGDTHKHEDNLSFTLFFDGLEWLIDPSFYVYEPDDQIAGYLRRAVAHNSVVVPDRPYSLSCGLASLTSAVQAEEFVLRGRHASYASLYVEREVQGRLDQISLRFSERVLAAGAPSNAANVPGTALLMLHCGDGVLATLSGDSLILTHPLSAFELAISLPSSACRTFHGETTERGPRGFAGLGYAQVTAITTIECAFSTSARAEWHLAARRRHG